MLAPVGAPGNGWRISAHSAAKTQCPEEHSVLRRPKVAVGLPLHWRSKGLCNAHFPVAPFLRRDSSQTKSACHFMAAVEQKLPTFACKIFPGQSTTRNPAVKLQFLTPDHRFETAEDSASATYFRFQSEDKAASVNRKVLRAMSRRRKQSSADKHGRP